MCYLESVQTITQIYEIGNNAMEVMRFAIVLVIVVCIVITVALIYRKHCKEICAKIESESKKIEATLLGKRSKKQYKIEIKEQNGETKKYNVSVEEGEE